MTDVVGYHYSLQEERFSEIAFINHRDELLQSNPLDSTVTSKWITFHFNAQDDLRAQFRSSLPCSTDDHFAGISLFHPVTVPHDLVNEIHSTLDDHSMAAPLREFGLIEKARHLFSSLKELDQAGVNECYE